jgi:hypothetical protein
MWLRDDVRCDDFADSFPRSCARIDSTTNSGNIATHNGRHQASVDLFPADETNIRGFHHRVGGFDHRHQATAFDHSECFRHQLPPAPQILTKQAAKRHKKRKRFF